MDHGWHGMALWLYVIWLLFQVSHMFKQSVQSKRRVPIPKVTYANKELQDESLRADSSLQILLIRVYIIHTNLT